MGHSVFLTNPCSSAPGAGSMAVVKPADHVKKGLEPRGSVERLTHPYVVATIRLCLGGG